jgi:epoxyqueuosine reductase QueG
MVLKRGSLQARLREQAEAMGATYFGVADLSEAADFVTDQGGDFLADYPLALSIGIVLADGVVDELHQHENEVTIKIYHHHIYSTVRDHLDRITGALASEIEQNGYRAYPVPSTGAYDQTRLAALISHKLAASLAGLGWIGKNALLISNKHGPRVRWATVLTDAPLSSTAQASKGLARCGSCTLCVDLCPINAFTGDEFDASVPVDERFNRRECDEYLSERTGPLGVPICGICVYVCPHGWSLKRKKSARQTTPALLNEQLGGLTWNGPSAESAGVRNDGPGGDS